MYNSQGQGQCISNLDFEIRGMNHSEFKDRDSKPREAGLRLFTGNRLELLADRLGEVIARPLSSPLEGEIIVVQSRGMARWLSLELARRLGICANIRYPFPNRFVQEVFEKIIPGFSGEVYPGPGVMAWMIMQRIPDFLEAASFRDIRRYLEEDETGLKRYQLAEKIASLFDQYLIYRPNMALAWERGNDLQWQAVLWRSLAESFGGAHPAAFYETFLEAFRTLKTVPADFPARISVFGISTLPPFHIRILSVVSTLAEVNLFLLNPCREYWGDIVSGREMMKIARRWRKQTAAAEPSADLAQSGDLSLDELHLEKGNSLLASMGSLGRDFFSLIYEMGDHSYMEECDLSIDPLEENGNLLAALQSDILNLRERGRGPAAKTAEQMLISPRDRSIQIHACHTPIREIEVLQDALLAMLDEDPGLSPRDILVMTPDIEKYAPFIQAVFSLPPEDPRSIPFSIADRPLRTESPYLESFLSLLDFHESRFGAAQVMALLDSRAIRGRFSLAEEDAEALRRLVSEAGVRWGMDAESRTETGLPGFAGNTWKEGLERMLLGCALTSRDELFQGILPFDIAAEDFQVLGRFVEFTDRLFSMAVSLREKRTLGDWAELLLQIVENFLTADAETDGAAPPGSVRGFTGSSDGEALILRRVLTGLRELETVSGFTGAVPFMPVRHYLQRALEGEGFGSGFLAGGITFCAMLPMRSIPFRVICLIGMNDEDYPRQEQSLGFDLIARNPQPGDRSRRNDDRYLFLEALLSARDRLYISYIGQSARDNSIRPPSVLVSELMDYIEQGFRTPGGDIHETIITRHRLQAFNPEYFLKAGAADRGKFFSYSRENCEAACRILTVRSQPGMLEPYRFIASPLAEPGAGPGVASGTEAQKDWRTIPVNDLCRFFSHPAKFFLNRRLRIYLGEGETLLDENEPLELEGLERYRIEQWLVSKGIQGITPKDLWPVARASGQIPPGSPGECIYREVGAGVEEFVEKALQRAGAGATGSLDVDVQIGEFRIVGRVPNARPEGLLYLRYAKIKASDRLRAWIYHLLLNRVCGDAEPRCELICRDFEGRYAPVADSEKILRSLLDIYWRGLSTPLPFIPEASWAYMERIRQGKPPEDARSAAQRQWHGNDFYPGEKNDPYYRTCFQESDPLDFEAFSELAFVVFAPLCECLGGGA